MVNLGSRLRTGRFRVKKRLKRLDNNGHVGSEICLVLNTQGRHGCQLSDHPTKKIQHYKTKPNDPMSNPSFQYEIETNLSKCTMHSNMLGIINFKPLHSL